MAVGALLCIIGGSSIVLMAQREGDSVQEDAVI